MGAKTASSKAAVQSVLVIPFH